MLRTIGITLLALLKSSCFYARSKSCGDNHGELHIDDGSSLSLEFERTGKAERYLFTGQGCYLYEE